MLIKSDILTFNVVKTRIIDSDMSIFNTPSENTFVSNHTFSVRWHMDFAMPVYQYKFICCVVTVLIFFFYFFMSCKMSENFLIPRYKLAKFVRFLSNSDVFRVCIIICKAALGFSGKLKEIHYKLF